MQAAFDQIIQVVGAYVPNLLGALAVLIVGWLVALAISTIVRRGLHRTTLDNRLARWISGGEEKAEAIEVERWTSLG